MTILPLFIAIGLPESCKFWNSSPWKSDKVEARGNEYAGGFEGAVINVFVILENSDVAEEIVGLLRCSSRGDSLIIKCFPSFREYIECISGNEAHADILITDVSFKSDTDTDVIELVRRHFPSGCGTQVIYVTERNDYCMRVYRTNHIYFLTIPLDHGIFYDAIEKAYQCFDNDFRHPISLRKGFGYATFFPHETRYIESNLRKVHVHTDSETIEVYARLYEVAPLLPNSFIQCHKSFLVNMDRIRMVCDDHVVLDSGERVPVSQRRRKDVRMRYRESSGSGFAVVEKQQRWGGGGVEGLV